MKNLFILSCLTFIIISCSTDEDDVNQGPNNFQIETIEYSISYQIEISGGIPYDVWSFSSNGTTDFQLDQNGSYTYNHPGYVFATISYVDGVTSTGTLNWSYYLGGEFENLYHPDIHCATAVVKIFVNNDLFQTDTFIVGIESWVDNNTPIWCQSDVANFYVNRIFNVNLNEL